MGRGSGRAWTLRRALRALSRRLFVIEESRVYRMSAARAASLAGGDDLARDAVIDFDAYQPDNPWDARAPDQRALVEGRLRDGAHAYTLVERGLLIHHSYMAAPSSFIELDYGLGSYALPPHSARLWDDNTHTAARGRGLHQASLHRRSRDAALTSGVEWVYIVVRADNGSSRHNIEKVGFEHVASVRSTRVLGLRVRRTTSGAGSPS